MQVYPYTQEDFAVSHLPGFQARISLLYKSAESALLASDIQARAEPCRGAPYGGISLPQSQESLSDQQWLAQFQFALECFWVTFQLCLGFSRLCHARAGQAWIG